MKAPGWLVFCLGGCTGAVAVVVGQLILKSVTIPEGLGDLLTGVATFMAALVAGAGVARWETRHRVEKRAEAAAQMIQAAWEVAETLLRLTSVDVAEDRLVPRLRRNLETLRDQAIERRLSAARALCSVYLPDDKLKGAKTLYLIAADFEDFFVESLLKVDLHGKLPVDEKLTISAWLDGQPKRIEEAQKQLKDDLSGFALPP